MKETFQAKLAILQERFRTRALADMRILSEIAADLASGSGGRRDELRQIAHALSGTGGTLGFPDISARATALEDLALAGSGAPDLAEACRALVAEIGRSVRPGAERVDAPDALAPAANRASVCIVDEPAGAAALAATLSHLGYAPVQAGPDTVAERMRQQACAALVISDAVAAPLELASAAPGGVPVLLITGDLSFEARLAAARAGVDAILPRPLDMNELADWLQDLAAAAREVPLSVVIVDDDRIAAEAHALALEGAGMSTHVVTDPTAALDLLTAQPPDLVLMDVQMPGVDGIELARVIRQSRRHLSLPIVFLSAERDPARQLEARRLGGDDFIVKPVDPQRLIPLVRMRAERAVALRSMMDRDSLTGLLNHGRFKDRVALELERCRRTGSVLSLALIDIDGFKAINDTYGHMSGDRVLRALAHALSAGLRRTDVVGRYGGEEFAVLLLDAAPATACATLNRIRSRFSDLAFESEGRRYAVTFSAGIAGVHKGDAGAEELIEAADRCLYQAKRGGRNCVVAG